MRSCYNKGKFNGLLIQGKIHEAVTYLQGFETKAAEVNKYNERFNSRIFGNNTNNDLINKILDSYSNYYVDYFWEEKSEIEARKSLQNRLMKILKVNNVEDFLECEELIGELIQQQGYYFLGGMTGMLYGPYVWKNSERAVYETEIPSGTQEVIINMMDGFISRSWLDFISFGKIGTGGWASESGELFCVKDSYKNKLNDLSFQISYLKHEAQHLSDYKLYGEIDSINLEYRAKLTELIYYPNLKLLHSFMNQSCNKDKKNTHSYASYLIISNLSKEIFNEEYVSLWSRWRGKGKLVREYVHKLLVEHSEYIQSNK